MVIVLVLLYFIIGILATWFIYELFKKVSENVKQSGSGKSRKVSDPQYADRQSARHYQWKMQHESVTTIYIWFLTPIFWPISIPTLFLLEKARKRNWNFMRYIVNEIIEPRENVNNG